MRTLVKVAQYIGYTIAGAVLGVLVALPFAAVAWLVPNLHTVGLAHVLDVDARWLAAVATMAGMAIKGACDGLGIAMKYVR